MPMEKHFEFSFVIEGTTEKVNNFVWQFHNINLGIVPAKHNNQPRVQFPVLAGMVLN